MKKSILGIAVFALITAGGIFIFAQRGDGQRFGGRGHFGARGFERMAAKLNLTDEQKTQVKQIMEDSKTRVEPLTEAMRETHKQAKDLGLDGVFNAEQVARIADAQGDATRRLVIEKEKTKAAIFAVLTPEQRTQAAEMKDLMEERFKGKFKKRFGGGEAPKGAEE
jgi:periplasmic protein CpxP/Spy